MEKYKVLIEEKLVREVEFEAENRIAAELGVKAAYENGDIVLDADDFHGDVKIHVDREGICPLCGAVVEYSGNEHLDDGGVHPWECPECGATGKEGYDEVFDGQHYDVADADGNPVKTD